MATVTGLTAARMLIIEGASIVGATISNYVLTLTRQNGTTINLGSIRGATGAKGDKGDTGAPGLGNIQTVNGKTDPNPVLNAADVGAVPTTQVATLTVQGIIELATAAEVAAKTDATRAVTPSTLGSHPGVASMGIAAGTVGAEQIVAGGSTLITVNFPTGRFTAPPTVIVAPISDTGLVNVTISIEQITATSVVIRRTNNQTATKFIGATWFAVA